MSREEFFRLVKLNWYCPKERLAERSELRRQCLQLLLQYSLTSAKSGLPLVLSLFGGLIVLALLVSGLRPPITSAAIPTLVVAAVLLLALLPPTLKFMRGWRNGWALIGLRASLILVAAVVFSSQLLVIEESRRSAMPIEARKALERREQNAAANAEQEAERRRLAEQSKHDDAAQAERAKTSAAELVKEVATINREQRDFYDTLGAPKLLYRCGGDQPLKAVGATRGTINMILKAAQAECSSSSIEILKRKDN